VHARHLNIIFKGKLARAALWSPLPYNVERWYCIGKRLEGNGHDLI